MRTKGRGPRASTTRPGPSRRTNLVGQGREQRPALHLHPRGYAGERAALLVRDGHLCVLKPVWGLGRLGDGKGASRWVDRLIDRLMEGGREGGREGWVGGWMDGWMDELIDGLIDRWMDGWIE